MLTWTGTFNNVACLQFNAQSGKNVVCSSDRVIRTGHTGLSRFD